MGAAVNLIRDDSLRVVEDGFVFDVRLNWYRSLPLSCVDILSVKVDGEQVPAGEITLDVNGHQYSTEELADRYEDFWFVQDFASLHVHQPGRMAAGETHTIDAEISLRFPYISIGPGRFLTNITRKVSTQTAQ